MGTRRVARVAWRAKVDLELRKGIEVCDARGEVCNARALGRGPLGAIYVFAKAGRGRGARGDPRVARPVYRRRANQRRAKPTTQVFRGYLSGSYVPIRVCFCIALLLCGKY